ncbi:MAG: sodium:solute symporter [Actinobacteria bacterium]|nr:sodium:solute symporter [Actinomycetota bacterium]
MVDPVLALVALVASLGLFAWVGVRAARHRGDLEDYLVARDSQGPGVLSLSFLASGLGAWILFAPPEVGAVVGVDGVAGYAAAVAAPFAALAVFGRRLRRVLPAGHTLTEFVRLRFGRAFHVYVAGVSIAYMLVFIAAELTAVGGITATLSGLDPRVGVTAVAAVTLAYTAYGGLRASLRTDCWQGWLLLALVGVAAGALVAGVSVPARELTPTGLLAVDRAGVESGVTLVLAVTAANLFHQGYWQRVWAARDTRSLARGATLAAVGCVPVVALVGGIGIVAAGSGVPLGDPPVPFFALLAGLPGWVGLAVLVLAVSLVASSVDTLESGLAALVAVERPAMSLVAARAVTVALVVPTVVAALQGYSVLRQLLIADLLCATAVVPALLGLWRRATPAGALAGALAGLAGAVAPGALATGSITRGVLGATFPDAVPTLPPFLGAAVASAAVAVAVSLGGRRRTDVTTLNERVPRLSGATRG